MFKFCSRRIGVELEYNSFDKLSRSNDVNNLPHGIYYFGQKISEKLKKNVEINKWHQTNNNSNWLVKPDSSCGLEVCSPPAQFAQAMPEIREVIECLAGDKNIQADNRCSLHVHVEVADFDDNDIIDLIERWIWYEHFFFFLTHPKRWLNRYCKPLGFFYGFDDKKILNAKRCAEILSDNKYFALNFYHFQKGKRKTIEFRIMDASACLDPDDTINWCKLLLCFVEQSKLNRSGKNTITDFSYKNLDNIFEFLNLSQYFQSHEVSLWVISKLALLSENDRDVCPVWKQILCSSKNSINNLIAKLQGAI